jgi:hypothetical protein
VLLVFRFDFLKKYIFPSDFKFVLMNIFTRAYLLQEKWFEEKRLTLSVPQSDVSFYFIFMLYYHILIYLLYLFSLFVNLL